MKDKGNVHMQVSNQKTVDEIVDDVLKDAGIEVDENSEEPVVFEYTDREVKEMIVGGRVRMLIKHPFSVSYTHLTLPTILLV